MPETVIVYVNRDRREYYFSRNHFQPTRGEGFTSVTHHLRSEATREDLVATNYPDLKEIPNPDPAYQA